jgi:hypothetical protein
MSIDKLTISEASFQLVKFLFLPQPYYLGSGSWILSIDHESVH